MRRWLIISPQYGTVVPVLDDGTGPMEYGSDGVIVEARTKREALVLGLRRMRSDPECHYHRKYDDGREDS